MIIHIEDVTMVKILLLFVDGFGIGDENPVYNPVFAASTPNLDLLLKNGSYTPTDACLGVEGLPQSATGQTTILTGINGAKVLGRHMNGFPTKTLKAVLNNHSIFKVLKEKGYSVTNANMFTIEYLQQLYMPVRDRGFRMSATTAATLAADIPFRTEEDLLAGKAVYHDITNDLLIKKGYKIPIQVPERAGKILADIAKEHNFTLFEYFQTDLAGHSQDKGRCIDILERFDRMLGGLINSIDFADVLLIVTSDHGNIEDLRVSTHTYNKVPTIFYGKDCEQAAGYVISILDIAPAIEKMLLNAEGVV